LIVEFIEAESMPTNKRSLEIALSSGANACPIDDVPEYKVVGNWWKDETSVFVERVDDFLEVVEAVVVENIKDLLEVRLIEDQR